jgi:hypothetical protein
MDASYITAFSAVPKALRQFTCDACMKLLISSAALNTKATTQTFCFSASSAFSQKYSPQKHPKNARKKDYTKHC